MTVVWDSATKFLIVILIRVLRRLRMSDILAVRVSLSNHNGDIYNSRKIHSPSPDLSGKGQANGFFIVFARSPAKPEINIWGGESQSQLCLYK